MRRRYLYSSLDNSGTKLTGSQDKINHTLADIKTKKTRLVKLKQALGMYYDRDHFCRSSLPSGTDQETLVAEENKPSVEQREKTMRDRLVMKVNLRLENIPKLKVRTFSQLVLAIH